MALFTVLLEDGCDILAVSHSSRGAKTDGAGKKSKGNCGSSHTDPPTYYKSRSSDFFDQTRRIEEEFACDWEKCPVTRELIEQINLCRNDGTHDPDISTTSPTQSEAHFTKYPLSFFADEMEAHVLRSEGDVPDLPLSIQVTEEKLESAINAARELCRYVEKCRTKGW
jgi:hypothetical protein